MNFFKKLFGSKDPGGQPLQLSPVSKMLDEGLYWKIIAESLANTSDQESQLEWLEERLRQLDPAGIISFKLRTDKLLHDSYNDKLWCAGYIMIGGCSDDAFDYFRCWVISRGKDVFYNAVKEPDSLITALEEDIEDYMLEELSYIPDQAFEANTSKDIYDHIDEPAFDKIVGNYPDINFSWEEEDPASMQAICPKLFDKFWDNR